MRIAMFTDSFFPELGGIQDSILASARELGRRGEQVLILAPQAAKGDFARAGVAVAEPDLGLNVTVRRLFALPVPSSTRQSRLVLPTLVPAGGRWRALAAFRPEVVHTQTFLGAGLEASAAARRLEVPLVGSNHWAVSGFSLYAPVARAAAGRLAAGAVAAYYNRCAWTSAPSAAALAEMRAHGFTGAGAVLSNPIDTARFHPTPEAERRRLRAALGLSDATIVHAGRLAREKHVDVLIRALPALAATVPDAMLALAGHGSARPALEALAGELGVAGRVRFLGTLDHAALARLYQASAVVAIASTSESQGMALLQAMASGLPAVGARHGPLVEYIPPECGLLAEPGEPAAFTAALARLLSDAVMRARMGEQAARWAARFAIPAVTDMWQDVYARAASGALGTADAAGWRPSCA